MDIRFSWLPGVLVLCAVAIGEGTPAASEDEAPTPGRAQLYQPGDLVHLTGCEGNRRLTNPRIDLLDAPPGPGPAYFVIRLKGTSEKTLCDGDVVIIREVRLVQGKRVARVDPIIEPLPEEPVDGWVRWRFLGAPFARHECDRHFESEEAVQKCLHPENPPGTRPGA